ncbi:MAG: RecX family transcriptional regulator [Oscillospiraceae bacterium]|nr:RecX family transcriptional regulator [Oscillospiraceae bacterium]
MMRIESLAAQPDRAGRYKVCLDDGSVLRLYRQTVEDFGLYAGKELEEEKLKQLRVAAGQMSAKMRAVRIVSASSVSKADLERRLVQKGETAADAKQAVSWMEELDLLDDRKTAQQVVDRCIGIGYGLARAKQALYEKKIPKVYWDEVLAEYPDQTEKILEFLRSRLGERWEERDLRRVSDALLRRGHSYGQIRKALQIYTDLQEEDEWQI